MSSRAVSDAARRTVSLAEALAPETFFQAAYSENGRALVLAFAGEPSPSVRQQLTAAAAPVRVEFRVVAHSMSVLEQVMDQISQDMPLWDARGAQVSGLGPNWTSNKVEIGVVIYEPGVAQDIELRYGGHQVEVLTRDEPFVVLT